MPRRLLLVAVSFAALALSATAPVAQAAKYDGTIYVESNSPKRQRNSVLAYRYRAGKVDASSVRAYRTGGRGIQDLSNSGALDAEQQIVTNAEHTLLFAVNAGSDTVAVFRIRADGSLRAVKGSPFKSRGRTPASVGVSGTTLFVANKAHDPARKLENTSASYASFRIRPGGALVPIGDPVKVPAGSSPTQAFPVPGANLMISTEEAGPWRVFGVGADGSLAEAPGSPHALEPEVFAPDSPKPGVWAQGISAHPKLPLLYAGAANIRRLVVYEYAPDGALSLVDSQFTRGAVLPCWTQIGSAGTRLYVGNAGSQNISVYDIGTDPRKPVLMRRVKLHGKGNPWNFRIDPSGRYLFMLNMRAVRQVPSGHGNTLHSLRIRPSGKLKEMRSSPVKLPVATGTNPWGMAVVPRR
jgi:6-phosphogluconolactonase (cycloisomerase 2 family)